jgi:YD repeat-containing protein
MEVPKTISHGDNELRLLIYAATLTVLAVASSVACAQSSVTLYGSIDGSLRYMTHADSAGDGQLTTGGKGLLNSNRFGVIGVEDLGGGLKAHFRLESAFDSGTGALGAAASLFSREATVGLSGPWGGVNVGRQFSVNARTVSSYDPFGFRYLSITPISKDIVGTSSDRFDNDVQYIGTFGNLTARAEYVPGGVAGSVKTGTAVAGGASYRIGPANFGAAYTQWNDFNGPGLNRNQVTAGGDVRFGKLRVTGGYIGDRQDDIGGDHRTSDLWIGTVYSFSNAFNLTDAIYRTDYDASGKKGSKTLLLAGITYLLSKQTILFAEVDNTRFTGTAIVSGQSNQTGIGIGISKWF